jgi:hypothetical protein
VTPRGLSFDDPSQSIRFPAGSPLDRAGRPDIGSGEDLSSPIDD